MDLLPESSEIANFSENRIYISATKNTNVSLLREMIKLKANKLLNKSPFRFIHSYNEHTKRLSWLFEHANFEDDSGVQFEDNRPGLFGNGYVFFDGYLNEQMLNAYKREFGNGGDDVFGFWLNWGENFESVFGQSESSEIVLQESLNEMKQFLDKCENDKQTQIPGNDQNRAENLKTKLKSKFIKDRQSFSKIEKIKNLKQEEKNYQSSIRNELNIPKRWNK